MHIKYRPEIDGLRALAVISVMIYHAEFMFNGATFLAGGFLGVDIFFVISGYLICKIILREMDSGKFTFLGFYDRRARRILPALFLMMAASLIYSWNVLLPKEMKEFAGSGFASLAFSSNVWFWLEDSYTAVASQMKPFLHTWSLSVEEQFYVFFPILLLILFRYLNRYISHTILAILIASLLYSQYLSAESVDANFYLLPSRIWELMMGGLLASIEINKGSFKRADHFSAQMSNLGLIMIVGAFIMMDDTSPHPSFLTMIPVLGCALVIQFSRPSNPFDLSSKLLSFRPMVSIGLVSYSLYLWHYPVFAFARVKDSFESVGEKTEMIAIAIALAIVSYFVVEKPMRNSNSLNSRKFYLIISLVFIALFFSFIAIYHTKGASFRIDRHITNSVDFNYWYPDMQHEVFSLHYGCWMRDDVYDEDDPFQACRSAERLDATKPSVMLIGDSHAASLIPGLDKVIGSKANILQRVESGCLPLYSRMQPHIKSNRCFNSINSAYQEAYVVQPDLFILAGRWRNADVPAITMLLGLLKEKLDGQVVLVGPLIYWKPQLPKLLKREIEKTPLEFPEYLRPHDNNFVLNELMRDAAEEAGVAYFSPVDSFCVDNRCKTRVNDKPSGISAYDNDHFTKDASIFFMQSQELVLEQLLNTSK